MLGVCSAPDQAGSPDPPVFDREVGMVRLGFITGARLGGAGSHRLRIRGFLALAGVGLALLLLTACGSDSGTPTVPGNGGGGDPPPTPAIALTISPASASVEAGSASSLTATVSRSGGFTGSVSVELQGLPSGVSASEGNPSTSGTTSTFAVAIETTTSATPGQYELTVRASGSGVSAVTRPFALTLTAPPPDDDDDGNGGSGAVVTVDFTGCLMDEPPIWVGFQNGTGAWDRAAGSGTTFTFPLTAEVGAYAWVMERSEGPITQAVYLTRGELLAEQPLRVCVTQAGEASMTGQVAGLGATEFATVSLGLGAGFASGAAPQLQVTGMAEGTFDLLAYRFSATDPRPSRFLLRRDVVVTDGGSLGTLDFGGSEAFAPATAQVTISGAGAAGASALMGYLSGEQCAGNNTSLSPIPGAGPGPVTVPGIPADRQRDGDVHQLTVISVSEEGEILDTRFFRTLADQSVTLPPSVEPAVSEVDGPYLRLRTTFPIPEAYRGGEMGVAFLSLSYAGASGGSERIFSTAVSRARLASATAQVTTPDLSGAPGWSAAWAVPSGASVDWFAGVSATSAPGAVPGNLCVDGAWIRQASRQGTW